MFPYSFSLKDFFFQVLSSDIKIFKNWASPRSRNMETYGFILRRSHKNPPTGKMTILPLSRNFMVNYFCFYQGGFSTNLAPGKLVGKLLNLFDSTAHRVVGGLPPPVPSTSGPTAQNEHHTHPHHHNHNHQPRVSASQSTMAMSSLVPSASMESEEGNNRRIMHNRSVSEPDFGRSPRQVVIINYLFIQINFTNIYNKQSN